MVFRAEYAPGQICMFRSDDMICNRRKDCEVQDLKEWLHPKGFAR